MSKYVIEDTTLIGIGNAIRTKKGTFAQIPVPNLASEIMSIESGLYRDKRIIPDVRNTGCINTSILTKYNHETSPNYGIVWRSIGEGLYFDCQDGKAFVNVLESTVIFENYDFTDYSVVGTTNSWSPDSAVVPNGCKIVFKNCLFLGTAMSYNIPFSYDDIHFEFINCQMTNATFGNVLFDKCLIGGSKWYSTRGFTDFECESNPKSRAFYRDCYFYDIEAPRTTQGTAHIDVMQSYADNDSIHFDNCRFEGIDMGYPSVGNWSYVLYWQGLLTNSSIKNCIANGGGYYTLSIKKALNQEFANNFVGADYSIPYYPDSTGELIQESDHAFENLSTIYVTSVWNEGNMIKFLVTNDFAEEKTLTVKTDNDVVYSFTLQEGATFSKASTQLDWGDLPIDVEFSILSSGIKSLEFYDGDTLIRTYTSSYPEPTGTINITSNGTYDVKDKASAEVSVPQPSGTINITQNGSGIDVTNYATANVNVPQGVFPSGTLSITENGTKDVTNYESVNVAVPQPSGSQTYTQNGTYDVSAIAEAVINVSGGMPSWIVSGEFTPDEDIESYTVTHGKNKLPIVALAYTEDRNNPVKLMHTMSIGSTRTDGTLTGAIQNANGATPPILSGITSAYNGISEFDSTKVTFISRSGYPFKTGHKYKYFIFFEEA